jgi:hypothetical protein
MKKIIAVVVALAVIAGLIAAYMVSSGEIKKERESEKPIVSEPRARESEGDVVLTLNEEAQKRLALKMTALAAAQYEPEVKGYGRVLDPAALSAMAADAASARAAANASEKEVQRLKILAGQDNASARALQAGEAAAERDRAAVEAAEEKFISTWGPGITERKDLTELLQSLARRDKALARVDLPAGELVKTQLTGASLTALAEETNRVAAEVIGPAPTVDPQIQGQGFLLLLKGHEPAFAPGAAVIGYLKVPGSSLTGVVVPSEAITRFNARSWVYVQTGAQTFVRREVSPQRSLAEGLLVTEGFKPGERVVVQGARMLLSEEQKHSIRMSD